MKNWPQTVLRQYNNSPTLLSFLTYIDLWLRPDVNFEAFYDFIWNVDTAVGYGLDVWGRIVVVPRTLSIPAFNTFGFAEATDRTGFNQSPFFEASIGVSLNYTLTDDAYRRMIFAKAAFNITDGSIPAINAILMNILFPERGNAWVTDGANGPSLGLFGFAEANDRLGFNQGPFGDHLFPSPTANMTLTYNFAFALEPFEVAMVKSGVLPKTTGVQAFWSYPGS